MGPVNNTRKIKGKLNGNITGRKIQRSLYERVRKTPNAS
jgi:hypothetical protein